MKRHLMTTLPALAVMVLATGCGGPTKTGMEARADANQRVDSFNANVTYEQARQAFETGDFDKALTTINSAIEMVPQEARFHNLQGRVYMETNRLEQAISAFETAQQNDPKMHEAFYYAGVIYQRWSDDEQAYENYRKAADLKQDSVQYLLAAAESLVAMGEFQAAKDLISPRVKYFEHNVALKQLQARIAMLLDDPNTAANFYAEARLLEPSDSMILEDLAWAQFKSGQYNECVDSLRSLRQRQGTNRLDLLQLEAQCLSMLDRTMEARDVFIQLSNKQPSNPDIWIELGAVCWELKDYQRMNECGKRLVNLTPNRYEGYLLKGVYEKNVGDRSEAIRQLRAAGQRATNDALPHVLLGLILEDTGFMSEALTAYRQALAIDPDNAEASQFFNKLEETMRITSAPTDQ